MDKSYIYMIFALLAGASFIAIVPKEDHKRCLFYGMLCGGMGDVLVASVLSMLGLIQYKEMGAFSIFGLFPIWAPIAWMYCFSIFFYLLPERWTLLIPFVLANAGFTYIIGLVMQNFGVFNYVGIQKYLALIVFLSWFSVSAWVYLKCENITVLPEWTPIRSLLAQPASKIKDEDNKRED